MSMSTSISNCINTPLFLFNHTYIKNSSKCCSKCSKNNIKTINPKCVIFYLNKCDFVASSISVSTSFDDSWNEWKNNIYKWKYANFVISLTKNNLSHSIYGKLIKIKIYEEHVKLYIKYNLPLMYQTDNCQEKQCLQCVINSFYKLKTECYKNIKFYGDENYKTINII